MLVFDYRLGPRQQQSLWTRGGEVMGGWGGGGGAGESLGGGGAG